MRSQLERSMQRRGAAGEHRRRARPRRAQARATPRGAADRVRCGRARDGCRAVDRRSSSPATTVTSLGLPRPAARPASASSQEVRRSTQGSGTARVPVPIALDPDQGYVRGPLVVSGSTLALAAYDHDGATFTYPPSRIVRVDTGTFREEGRTDLKAEILSIADGDGARWVVTRNPAPANGLPDAFLKRIGADGAVVSKLLPAGSDPVGDVAVGAGSVWIPVRDGVLRYDTATGQFVAKTALAAADTRAVAVANGTVSVTDGEPTAHPCRSESLSGRRRRARGAGRNRRRLLGPDPCRLLHVGSEPTPTLLPVGFAPTSVAALEPPGLGRGNRQRIARGGVGRRDHDPLHRRARRRPRRVVRMGE